ncbi:MAG: hypothetical protein ACOY3P_22665 [Planctomycetota bacterium]
MARDHNTYAKRQRDLQKKQKSEDKKARRERRKELAKSVDTCEVSDRSEAE